MSATASPGFSFEEAFMSNSRFFLGVAFGSFEPIGALMAHDLGDFPAVIEFADAFGVVVRARFIYGCTGWGGGFVLSGGEFWREQREREQQPAKHGVEFHSRQARRK